MSFVRSQLNSACLATSEQAVITKLISESFNNIAPFWPLKNLIAVNPLLGWEDLPFEQALINATKYFEQNILPWGMQIVNRETIKWLQVYFDEGQATITMPLRHQRLLQAWRQLALYDSRLHHKAKNKKAWLQSLPKEAWQIILMCLLELGIAEEKHCEFLTLMLTTLPGWASYIKYHGERCHEKFDIHIEADYLAIRLIITVLLWPCAFELFDYSSNQAANNAKTQVTKTLERLHHSELNYQHPLLKQLATKNLNVSHMPDAQLVFCIDVRSEPFRRTLESLGNYQTFGFAGFFGLPVTVNNPINDESYASCPVLIAPKHIINELPCSVDNFSKACRAYQSMTMFKRLYQSLKYNFSTPFMLVDSLGFIAGLWTAIKTFVPNISAHLKDSIINKINKSGYNVDTCIDSISFSEQCTYAKTALNMMGLSRNFAPLVVLCGHGSTTTNNAFATALDCGACGGRHGGSNARILAKILNQPAVRQTLSTEGIEIPDKTNFLAAEHNTTTDEIYFLTDLDAIEPSLITKLQSDLIKAKKINSARRLLQLSQNRHVGNATKNTEKRANDWAEVRPEWGLARNAAFIVAPRELSSGLDLEGRCFLHSYDYSQDSDSRSLRTILTAPMIVAEWINMQYLFSTLNNVAYGSGSKITQNVTGKMGIMQGNASDLMTGLPLQSVNINDTENFHEPARLMTIVFAPRKMLDVVISSESILQKLFSNGWAQIACIEPQTRCIYLLTRDLIWKKTNQQVHSMQEEALY